jgi:hypothetical protein
LILSSNPSIPQFPNPSSYKIDVQLAFQDKNSLADLEYFHITTDAGKQVPLAAVATLDTGRGFARISRINSRRTVTIRGDVDTQAANTNEIIADEIDTNLEMLGYQLCIKMPDRTIRNPDYNRIFDKTAKRIYEAVTERGCPESVNVNNNFDDFR